MQLMLKNKVAPNQENMNILPKKRWHVRTKENIARVRRDEAEAAEKERKEKLRIENADREARLNILKQKSIQKLKESGITPSTSSSVSIEEHVNFFSDVEHTAKTSNKDHDNEAKDKKEEYEKQIGYLTYLGQDTNEALGKKNWYEVSPEVSRYIRSGELKETYNKLVLKDADGKDKPSEIDIRNGEVAWKSKQSLDPLNIFKKPCTSTVKPNSLVKHTSEGIVTEPTEIYKKKEKKKHSEKEDKLKKLEKLREARLKREKEEKQKTHMFLVGLSGITPEATVTNEPQKSKIKPKYNSQFNPEFARQNYR